MASAAAVARKSRPRRTCDTFLQEPLGSRELLDLRLDQLRDAVRANLVSFPSPPPVFDKHDRPDLQWRLAELYFVMGWNCQPIASRYGLIRQRIGQILKTWKKRAIEMGYIQYLVSPDTRGAGLMPINIRNISD